MVISFILLFGLFAAASIVILLFMSKKKINNRNVRKYVVRGYKMIYVCSCVFGALSLFVMLYRVYIFEYNMMYQVLFCVSGEIELSRFITLTLILVSVQPTMYLILKLLKKKWFEKEIFEGTQGLETDMISKITRGMDLVPVKGIIHSVNLVLVVLANSYKALGIESNITATSIYMSVATYYALDRVIDYFGKKYKSFWKYVDNKIFKTEEIEKTVVLNFEQMREIRERIFSNYIETGKYEMIYR